MYLNNNTFINLEMQVRNEYNWPDRSLSYLCRTFDHLVSGEDYTDAKPCYHIGILDFELFPEYPEFYAMYRLQNVKKHYLYNDKFALNVLYLNQIELATEEDKLYGIDYWAKLFKSTTWEELKMIADKNEYLKEASTTLYTLSQDQQIRYQCEAREEYNRTWNGAKRKFEALTSEIEVLTSEIAEKDEEINRLKQLLSEKNSIL